MNEGAEEIKNERRRLIFSEIISQSGLWIFTHIRIHWLKFQYQCENWTLDTTALEFIEEIEL